MYTQLSTCFLHDRPWTRTLDAPLGDVPLYYIGKHVKQTLVDTYHHKFSHGFRKKKPRPFRRSSMSMFKRWDIGKMFHQFDEWGLWCRGNRKSFQLGFETASSSSGFLKSNEWLCCIGCWLWNGDVSSDEQLEQKNIFSDWWWKTKIKTYFNFWLYACTRVLIYEGLVVTTRIVIDARGAWRFGHCDVSRVAHKKHC